MALVGTVRIGVMAAVLAGLAGCGAVETYRAAAGLDKNDPDPATTPFTQNLASADAAAYPNLATVPPPPNRATSAAEREKLTQSLIAERGTLQEAGGPPPPPGALPATSGERRGGPGVPELASNKSGLRPAGQPPDPQPLESSLQMPQVRSLPEPDETRPAPARPTLAAVPRVAPAPMTPAAVEAGTPMTPPPAPIIAPMPPPPDLADAAAAPRRPQPGIVVSVEVSGTDIALTTDERSRLADVAGRYAQQPGNVRVVAYTSPGATGPEQLAEYRAALDRARAIARALAENGIPANKIQAEAAPVIAGKTAGRIEVQLAR